MPFVQYQEIQADDVKRTLHTLLQAGARLYMHFANETIATFDQAGEMTIRTHLREYGKWRASEMREAHNALGKEINMETLNRCWDSASVFIVQDDLETKGKYTPYDVIYDVHYCPASEAWKAEGFHRWGHVYCDEFHQACASSYHPDGNVVIPINMMKGDDHCHFRWVMPGGAREIDYFPPSELGTKLAAFYQADTPERGAYDALVRTNRLIAGRYLTMARALRERHQPDEADACMSRALRSWGKQRGQLLREQHHERGIAIDARNLFHESDLASQYVWDLRDEVALPDRYEVVVGWSPMEDAWADLSAAEEAKMFWQESFPAMVNAYSPALRAEIAELTWDGDEQTRIVIQGTAS